MHNAFYTTVMRIIVFQWVMLRSTKTAAPDAAAAGRSVCRQPPPASTLPTPIIQLPFRGGADARLDRIGCVRSLQYVYWLLLCLSVCCCSLLCSVCLFVLAVLCLRSFCVLYIINSCGHASAISAGRAHRTRIFCVWVCYYVAFVRFALQFPFVL